MIVKVNKTINTCKNRSDIPIVTSRFPIPGENVACCAWLKNKSSGFENEINIRSPRMMKNPKMSDFKWDNLR